MPQPTHEKRRATTARHPGWLASLRRGLPCLLLALASWHLPTPPTMATVFVRTSDPELVDHSPAIVEGRILSLHGGSLQDGSGPALEYRLQVLHAIKGQPPEQLRLRIPGGPSGGAWWMVAGAPRFRPDDEVLLFLEPRPDGSWGLYQLMLGAFRIVDAPGGSLVVRDLSDAHEIHLADRPAVLDGPRHLETFRLWLSDRVQGISRAADYFAPFPSDAPVEDPPADDDPPDGEPGHGTTGTTGGVIPGGGTDGDELAQHPLGSEEKTTSEGFQTIVSTNDPPPLGCGAQGGHSVRWFDFDVGGEVVWRAYFSGQPGLDSLGIDELETALAAWRQPNGPPIELAFGGLTSADNGLTAIDGTNAVLFDDPNNEIGGSWIGSGVLALGGPWFRCDLVEHQGVELHPVVEGDIILQDGLSAFFANNPAASSAAEELFAHELGHTLGFAHSLDPEALMYSQLHDDGRGASLSTDDRTGLDYLYGAGSQAPPAAPSGLSATATAPRRIELAWSDGSSEESGFRIERHLLDDPGDEPPGPFEVVGTAARNSESWIDNGVVPDTTYAYRIRAQNGAGGSPYTPEAIATTPQEQIPAAPSHLRVAALTSQKLRLTWQDNATNELGYRIEILGSGQGDFIEVPVLLITDTRSAILNGLEPDQTYSLRVRAFNSLGSSAPSNIATVRTFPLDAPCEITPDTLCLLGGRFELRLDYRNQHDGGSEGQGRILPDSDNTGFFWFFDPSRLEVVVKMVDGRSLNGHFWIYVGGLTDLEYSLTVTDTHSGEVRRIDNPPGTLCGRADIELFADIAGSGLAEKASPPAGQIPIEARRLLVESNPEPGIPAHLLVDEVPGSAPASTRPETLPRAVGSCQPGPTTLCLLDRRLAVEVSWNNPFADGVSGEGQVIEGSNGSGMFWFFDPRNLELIIKAVDGTAANGHLWIFYGALSDLEYWIGITDTSTGDSRTYYNPPGNLCGRADIEAFTAPASPGDP